MTILFVMQYPLYLRHFETVVRLLAEHGHTVYIAYDKPEKMAEGGEALQGAGDRIITLGATPKRSDLWAPVARSIRGAIDYSRYLHPRLAQARYLRGRMEKVVTPVFCFLPRIRVLNPFQLRVLLRCLLTLENAVPSSSRIEAFLRSIAPDVVVVTPLVNKLSAQTDILKSAQALGIPTGLCVGSWDHLTTKGLIRVKPDLVTVWNETQRAEAKEFHDIDPSRVVVTGAQTFDPWFGRQPTLTYNAFCNKVGLPADKQFVLFVGSTASISAPDAELKFVRRWIQALRASKDAVVRDLAVLVRPHPYNLGLWGSADLSDLEDVAVWPRTGANPVNESDRADYFHSLYYSAAVVGINTSAMIEAAILGRPVHTVLAPEFADTQEGTLHFHYLRPEYGGFVRVAKSLDEHVSQLADSVAHPEAARAEAARFVQSFVRPNGLDQACAPLVVAAIEKLGETRRRQPSRLAVWLYPVRWALGICAILTLCRDPEKLGKTLRKRLLKHIESVRKSLRRRFA